MGDHDNEACSIYALICDGIGKEISVKFKSKVLSDRLISRERMC